MTKNQFCGHSNHERKKAIVVRKDLSWFRRQALFENHWRYRGNSA